MTIEEVIDRAIMSQQTIEKNTVPVMGEYLHVLLLTLGTLAIMVVNIFRLIAPTWVRIEPSKLAE